MEFSRQEYWSGLPFPSAGELPDPGIKPRYPSLWTDALPSQPLAKAMFFSNCHVQMWELDHKEGWAPKSGCFLIVVLEKTLESPSDSKEIKPVNPKGNQSWIFIGRTEAETRIPWPPDVKSWLIGKDSDSDVGKAWWPKEKRASEDEMVGWYHPLNRDESEQTPRDSEGQGSLAYCSPQGRKELDTQQKISYLKQ